MGGHEKRRLLNLILILLFVVYNIYMNSKGGLLCDSDLGFLPGGQIRQIKRRNGEIKFS